MSQITVEEFRNFFKYFNSEAHQIKAVDELYASMDPLLLDDRATWIATYRTAPEKPADEPAPSGYVTAELMSRLTPHPASSYDDVFINDCTDYSGTQDLTSTLMPCKC